MQFTPAQQHALAWTGLAAVTALVLWLLGPVLMPFVVAAVLAYVLSPLVRGLQRLCGRRLPRLVAVVLVEVLFLLLLVALFTLLIPILAHELPRMRDMVESARSRVNLLVSRRYARLARGLHSLVAEVTELTERVDNALQVTEDVYLARVYAAAMELFRVPNVSAAVDRKLASARETYTALHSEAAGGRAEVLETAILLLIAVEIILSLIRH
jgi:predicted PurR-regulated permease PerM